MRLTDRVIKSYGTPEKGQVLLWDDEVKGFGARITAGGARSFILNYRTLQGRERRVTIGGIPEWSTALARDEAKRMRRDVDLGNDPLAEREQKRDAMTVATLMQRYVEKEFPRLRPASREAYQHDIDAILPRLGPRSIEAVRRIDVEDLHRALTRDKGPYRANHAIKLLRRVFNVAIKWEITDRNPASRIEQNYEPKRERCLSPAEIQRLTAALGAHRNQQSADAVRLLLLTGARKSEVLSATWDQFDLEAGVWCKPYRSTKQKRDHRAPLSAPALQVLQRLKAMAEGNHLFPGKGDRDRQTYLKTFWRSVARQAGLEGVRIHDLRHSYASILASSGLSLPIIGALLGHTQPGTTARYAHLYDDPLRAATERVGAIVSGAGKAEVVPLMKGKR